MSDASFEFFPKPDVSKHDPVSAEAKAAGLDFCCGKYERLVLEVAALRNVVQVAMIRKDPAVFEAWNRQFPAEQRDLPQNAKVSRGVEAPEASAAGATSARPLG